MISILCRFGELFLKGGNRGFFLRAMTDNVRRSVRDLPDAKVSTPYGRAGSFHGWQPLWF